MGHPPQSALGSARGGVPIIRIELIQSRTISMRDRAMDVLVSLIDDIKKAKQAGATDDQLAEARDWQKKGQFLIDYVFLENSSGFHAPQEAARLLVTAMDHIRSGQLALRQIG